MNNNNNNNNNNSNGYDHHLSFMSLLASGSGSGPHTTNDDHSQQQQHLTSSTAATPSSHMYYSHPMMPPNSTNNTPKMPSSASTPTTTAALLSAAQQQQQQQALFAHPYHLSSAATPEQQLLMSTTTSATSHNMNMNGGDMMMSSNASTPSPVDSPLITPRFASSAAAIMAARYQQYQHYHLYEHGSACSCCEPINPNSMMNSAQNKHHHHHHHHQQSHQQIQQQQQQQQIQQQQQQQQQQQPLKSPNSCRQCRASHRRCDRLLPSCTQCLKRKVAVTCVYEPLKTQSINPSSGSSSGTTTIILNNSAAAGTSTSSSSTNNSTSTTSTTNNNTSNDNASTSPSATLHSSSSSSSLSDTSNKKKKRTNKKRKARDQESQETEEQGSTTSASTRGSSPASPPSDQVANMILASSASSSSTSGGGSGSTRLPYPPPSKHLKMDQQQPQKQMVFDGEQVEKFVMEHPSSVGMVASSSNSSGSSMGSTTDSTNQSVTGLQFNLLSPSSHQILDGCFKLVSPKEMGIHSDEFEHNLIAQFLWNKSAMAAQPQSENSIDQQAFLDQKASQALWFAFQAIALQQLPAMEKSPYVNTVQETRLCERVLEKLLYSMVNIKRNVSSLVQLMCKFPRTLLMQASRNMCKLAEQVLLDPKIFPFIGKHMVLAQACCFLVFYLLVIGEQPEEAAVFLKAVKVYADREQRVLDIAPANVTNVISRQQLQTQQMVIQGLIDAYAAMKSTLWFNSAAPKQNDFHTKKSLNKFIKLSLQAALVGSSYSSDSRLVLLKQHECLKRLKAILDSGDDTKDQLYRFLLTCQEMRRDATNLPVESFMNTIWHIYVFNFEVFALEIAAAQLNCDFAQLQSIQVNLANEIAQEWLNCLPVVISSGARSMNLLKFISRVHIQHSAQLCSNMNVTSDQSDVLTEALKFLQIDIIILDAIHNKYGVTKYREMSDQVKIQEQIHKRFLDQTLGLQTDNVVPSPQANVSVSPPSGHVQMDSVEGATTGNNLLQIPDAGMLVDPTSRQLMSPLNESLFMDLFNWQGY